MFFDQSFEILSSFLASALTLHNCVTIIYNTSELLFLKKSVITCFAVWSVFL